MDALYMSSTEQNISAIEVEANHATLGSINSGSIVNDSTITTDGLTVDGATLLHGNLVTNGSATIYGALKAIGGISFGDVAFIHDGTDFTINGNLSVKGSAIFGYDSIIGHDTFIRGADDAEVEEGVISAHNLRATNRLFVGDSPFEVNSIGRYLAADTFTATFSHVKSAKATIANGVFTNFRATSNATFDSLAEFVNAKVTGVLTANEIQVQSFTAISEFLAKGLTVDGSAKITGGLVVSGANQTEAALCVNNLPAIFNHGIKVYHKSGVLAQTLTVFGTTNTMGTGEEETEEDKYAFNTDIGVRTRFQGDVLVKDAMVQLNNSPLLAERIIMAPVSTIVNNADTLEILKSGDGFAVHAEQQMIYDGDSGEDDMSGAIRTSTAIKERAATPYTGRIVDIASSNATAMNTRAIAKELMARRQARAVNISELTRPFRVHSDDGTQYRLDAGGNVLLKKAIVEQVQASKIAVNELTADTVRTNNFQMDNVAVEGVVTARDGASIGDAATNTGSTEVYGDVYNYGKVVNKDASSVEFREQATAKFTKSSTLMIQDGGSLMVENGAYTSLHGLVEIDLAGLVLYNSNTGKKYKLILRDAVVNEDGDEKGDVALEFGEIKEKEEEPVMTTTSEDTRNRATLRADLEEFQEKLKRI